MSKLRLGIIGMSEGNGHPYSWSAIFNGYNPGFMKDCPFPVIPDYLSKQIFPEDGLGHLASVTHVWCQDSQMAEHIAVSSNIKMVVSDAENMIGNIDALLLARDDAENHLEMSLPFLKSGIPVFIDKPLALTNAVAEKIFSAQKYPQQVFTCTALRFSKELLLTKEELEKLGEIKMVEGSVMKKWQTYAIHVLEPLVAQLPHRGKLKSVIQVGNIQQRQVLIDWENVSGYIKTTGDMPCPLEIKFFGTKGNIVKTITDTFSAFKNSLEAFIDVIHHPEKNIAREETLELVTILEKGML